MTHYLNSANQSKLIHNVKNTPLGHTKLDFSNALKKKSVSQIIEIFQAIPDYIVALDLNSLNLGARKAEELNAIFAAIPAWVSSVDLSFNDLNRLTEDGLILALNGFHAHISRIHLKGNNLGHKSTSELSAMLTALAKRDKLHALDLSWNKLYLRRDDFDLIFSSEANQDQGNLGNIRELNLSDNNLSVVPTAKLIDAFTLFSGNLSFLILGGNYLSEKNTSGNLSSILQAIPDNVTALGLDRNGLSRLETNILISLLKELPKQITFLSLSADNFFNNLQQETLNDYFGLTSAFDDKTDGEVEKILTSIPDTIKSLDLSGMLLGGRGIDFLIRVMKSLPTGVTTLDFSANQLGNIKTRDLPQLFKAIPSHVTSINLSSNDFGEMKSSELKTAYASFPKHVTSISLSDNKFSKKNPSELVDILSAIPIHVKNIDLANNQLFKKTKTTDCFFSTLQSHVNEPERFNWSGNGESNFARALAPMISLATKGRTNQHSEPLPADNVATILSFLTPASVQPSHIKELVIEKESSNSSKKIVGNNSSQNNLFGFFKKFFSKKTIETDEASVDLIL